jgi:Tol biopolymer transport system component
MARVTFADLDGSDRTIIQTPSEAWNANWSPNGDRIAFQSYPEGEVYVYRLTTRERHAAGFGHVVDWLDDDTLLILV